MLNEKGNAIRVSYDSEVAIVVTQKPASLITNWPARDENERDSSQPKTF